MLSKKPQTSLPSISHKVFCNALKDLKAGMLNGDTDVQIKTCLVESDLFIAAKTEGVLSAEFLNSVNLEISSEDKPYAKILAMMLKEELFVAGKAAADSDEEAEEEVEETDDEPDDEEEDSQGMAAAQKFVDMFSYRNELVSYSLDKFDSHTGRRTMRLRAIRKSSAAKTKVSVAKSKVRDFVQKIGIDGAFLGLANLMKKHKTVEVGVKMVGTIFLPFFAIAGLIYTAIKLSRNPLKAILKPFRDVLQGSELEQLLEEN